MTYMLLSNIEPKTFKDRGISVQYNKIKFYEILDEIVAGGPESIPTEITAECSKGKTGFVGCYDHKLRLQVRIKINYWTFKKDTDRHVWGNYEDVQ